MASSRWPNSTSACAATWQRKMRWSRYIQCSETRSGQGWVMFKSLPANDRHASGPRDALLARRRLLYLLACPIEGSSALPRFSNALRRQLTSNSNYEAPASLPDHCKNNYFLSLNGRCSRPACQFKLLYTCDTNVHHSPMGSRYVRCG